MLPIQTPNAQACVKCMNALNSALAELDRWTMQCKIRATPARTMARRAADNRAYLARLDAIDCRFQACPNSVKQ